MSDNLQKVHGDVQPVFHMDTANGAKGGAAVATGATVNLMGPGMDFIKIVTSTDLLEAECGVGEAVEAMLKCVGQLATVQMYSVGATNNTVSIAVYPKGAWALDDLGPAGASGNLTAALQLLGTITSPAITDPADTSTTFSLATVTVTMPEFALA